MKNKAFTLAETLIVLSIIGVLATVMLSAMSKMSPDKTKMKFKKAYQTVERTVGELVNDENLYPYDPDKIGFQNISEVTWPGSSEKYSGETKFKNLFKRKLNTIGTYSGNGSNTYFITSDGIGYLVETTSFTSSNPQSTIFVDTNGEEKPNCVKNLDNTYPTGCSEDKQDIFRIFVSYDGKVQVSDPTAKKYLKSSSTAKD